MHNYLLYVQYIKVAQASRLKALTLDYRKQKPQIEINETKVQRSIFFPLKLQRLQPKRLKADT